MARNNEGFEYPYTCPTIDKCIDECEDIILYNIERFLCSNFSSESYNIIELSKELSDSIYEKISYCFENVRETNEKMRNAADKQIIHLNDEINDLNYKIENLEDEKYHLENKIDDLNDEINDLNYKIENLED